MIVKKIRKLGKGKIYLEKLNMRVNGQEKPSDALIYENEDGKKMLQFIADILNEISCMELRIAEMKLMIGE